jgi:plastocyanin
MKSLLFLFLFLLLFPLSFSGAVAKTIAVKIEAMQFIPNKVQANVGDTIEWNNKDFFPHTATALDKSFDSKSIPSQQKWVTKVQKPGTFKYQCLFHPVMKASVIVL